ncbi:MAG TPA: alpha/beta fold hydrolase [Xanthobacteraceae bacterium]|nr:alpha/beta fold hydrolase [Xanthobacteraceae bacterium]
MNQCQIARRTLLAGASVGLAAGLAGRPMEAAADPALADIWSNEYWAHKGDVKLNLWRKRVGAPKPGEPPLPVLFLVHGSSLSARPSYDLTVPGDGDYSLMNVFARYGYDVWTMDHDGYGYSGSSGNNSDIASGVEDLKAAMPVVMQETGRSKFHFYGESSGAIRVAAFAQAMPDRVDRLMLAASTYKGEGAAEIQRRRDRIAELRSSPRRKRDAAMIRSIFSRDGHPGIYDPAMVEALVAAELKFGDTIPAGTYIDMAVNLPLVDPKQVLSPALMTRGEWDGNSTDDDLLDFFRQLPNGDRQYVILPNTAHSQGFSKNRQLLWYAMKNFLAEPAPAAS